MLQMYIHCNLQKFFQKEKEWSKVEIMQQMKRVETLAMLTTVPVAQYFPAAYQKKSLMNSANNPAYKIRYYLLLLFIIIIII